MEVRCTELKSDARPRWAPHERGALLSKGDIIASAHASPEIVLAMAEGFGHRAYWIEAIQDEGCLGTLGLVFMKTPFFGKILVGLPYLNWGGVFSSDAHAFHKLVDRAVSLADDLGVRFLELRHEIPFSHPALSYSRSDKVQMRMPVTTEEKAWSNCRSTVRTQIRKGDKQEFKVRFGKEELLPDFYRVFSQNMRDLGTPVYSKTLFYKMLEYLPKESEVCVVYLGLKPVACAFCLHHSTGLSEVPSASALKDFRSTAVNTWMYWKIIQTSIQKGSNHFDFGRSTPDSPTFEFKRKWGAEPSESCWQYYSRTPNFSMLSPSNPKYSLAIRTWKRLPLKVANLIGPMIVRGIP